MPVEWRRACLRSLLRKNEQRSADVASCALSDLLRTTKASGKLKILPEEPEDNAVNSVRPSQLTGRPDSDEDDESSDDDDDLDAEGAKARKEQLDRAEVNKQLAQIPEGSMRRDARRLTRKGRASLPRVTAYSTAT